MEDPEMFFSYVRNYAKGGVIYSLMAAPNAMGLQGCPCDALQG